MSRRRGEPVAGRPARAADPEIVLSESAGVRYLHFGTEWVQGAMRIRRPDELVLDYQRHMMAWLLFLPGEGQVLQIGLGAGAMSRFVRRRLPACDTTVVEISAAVLDVVRARFGLPEDDRLRVALADGASWVADRANRDRYDVIQVDAYDREARGPVLDSPAFYRACRAALREPGVLVVNLFGDVDSFAPNLERICAAFQGQAIVLPPVEAGNVVVLAFAGPPVELAWELLYARAAEVERETGLRARGWVNALRAREPDDSPSLRC